MGEFLICQRVVERSTDRCDTRSVSREGKQPFVNRMKQDAMRIACLKEALEG